MRTKRCLPLATLAVSACVVAAAAAPAGEVRGPSGVATPVKDPGVANSACAFSGYNDFGEGQTGFHVQSYGVDVAGLTDEEPFGQPGTGEINCRGTH